MEEENKKDLLSEQMTEEEVEKAIDAIPDGETEEWEDDQTISPEEVTKQLQSRAYLPLRETLMHHRAADIAALFGELEADEYPLLFRILPKKLAAEVFVEMDAEDQAVLIRLFSDKELRAVLDEMAMDDLVDLVEEMPANVVRRILTNATPDDRAEINQLLQYPKDSAGSIMTTEYVCFRQSITVEQAFRVLRQVAIDKETIYTCYVVDAQRHLIGLVTVKKLLLSPLDAVLSDIMTKDVVSVGTHTDKEDVAMVFDRYRFLALPVVDAEERLVGIITFDDAVDVIHEETEEDFAKMAAITPAEEPYLKTSVFTIWKTRIPWLMLLMLSATFTGIIITSFENALAACVALSSFIPMLMDTGGNSGSQASVTVIRGISLGEIGFRDLFAVLFKELRVSLLCGVVLAVANFGKIMLVDHLLMGMAGSDPLLAVQIALTVSLALCVTVVCAKLVGCSLPLLAKKIGFDPAVMASPFITTLVDAISLLVYFGVARAIIPTVL